MLTYQTEWLCRTEMLVNPDNMAKLRSSHVLVVGLGGVGAYAAEMICRAGVGRLTIIDGDCVQPSNRNRQLLALCSNDGRRKTEIMEERLRDINPELQLETISEYIHDQALIEIASLQYDYVVDAIDTLSPKIFLLYYSLKNKNKIVSSMGAGGKLDPLKIQIDDISKTQVCSLACSVRKRLRKLGVTTGIKTVFSTEPINKKLVVACEEQNKRSVVGTISYMPAIFGCICASVVIRDLCGR